MKAPTRLLVTWALVYFVVTIFSAFLHQCGHGVGSLVDGVSISTGVATAGDPGKRPSDPGYRAILPMTGRLNTTSLMGPFTNWLLGIAFAVWLAHRSRANLATLVIGAAAMANGGIRIFPVLRFLVSVARHQLWLDDEATWGLATNPALRFPMTFSRLDELMATQPEAITHYPAAYFWPCVSLLICTSILFFSYPRLVRMFRSQLKTGRQRLLFILMPFLITPAIVVTAHFLDEYIRINW